MAAGSGPRRMLPLGRGWAQSESLIRGVKPGWGVFDVAQGHTLKCHTYSKGPPRNSWSLERN